MSTVNEAIAKHMTLGYISSHYGFELVPGFAGGVTVTSLCDDAGSVRPGALYIPPDGVDCEQVDEARQNGAYAVLLPLDLRDDVKTGDDFDMPVLLADLDAVQLGRLAGDIAGVPSDYLATFVVCGRDGDEVRADAVRVADFLHLLGNPVGLLSASGSFSLERPLDLHYPLGVFDVQHTMSICLEDSASAMVISADEETLKNGALQSVNVDVLGCVEKLDGEKARAMTDSVRDRFGFASDRGLKLSTPGDDAARIASQASSASMASEDGRRRLALAISMALDAGVRRGNIRSALRVSQEMR